MTNKNKEEQINLIEQLIDAKIGIMLCNLFPSCKEEKQELENNLKGIKEDLMEHGKQK